MIIDRDGLEIGCHESFVHVAFVLPKTYILVVKWNYLANLLIFKV